MNRMLVGALGTCAAAFAPLSTAFHALYAQPAVVDARILARADSITVGSYCRAAQAALALPIVRDSLAEDLASADRSALRICVPSLNHATLRALYGDRAFTLYSIARLHQRDFANLGDNTFAAMDELRRTLRSERVRPLLRTAIGALNDTLTRAAETANQLLVIEARNAALNRLANYERKLGPTSARLNAIETALNYGAQRFIPGFTATPSRGPSPWEVVAAYVPTYGTVAAKRAQAVSASEFGLRRYLFGPQFGAEGWRGLVRPSYWSAGALVVSDRNGALVWPWQDKQRTGAFLSWGTVKLGYVKGRQGEWLISRQIQLVPLVF